MILITVIWIISRVESDGASLSNFTFNEIFCLECRVEVTCQLACNAEERSRLLSMIILDAIGNFGNGSDSPIIGRIENLGYCT